MLFSFKQLENLYMNCIYTKNRNGYVKLYEDLHKNEPTFVNGCLKIIKKFSSMKKEVL